MATDCSPMGWFYRFDPTAPSGQRLFRRRDPRHKWEDFSIQLMTPDELRYVASVIDEARFDVHDV